MTGVHRLQEVKRLAAADFSDDQTVRTQTLSTMTYDTLKGTPSAQTINPDPEVATTDRYSVNGKAADNAFFNCYNMTFYHTFDKKKDAKNSERN